MIRTSCVQKKRVIECTAAERDAYNVLTVTIFSIYVNIDFKYANILKY